MRKFVGKVGVIQGYDDLDNTYIVAFGDNEFYYPASLIHEHLVEEVPSGIIDLSNVEGVEMMVRYNNKTKWIPKKIVAKCGDYYIDNNCDIWYFAKPILPQCTLKELQEIVGHEFEIKEVSNEQKRND